MPFEGDPEVGAPVQRVDVRRRPHRRLCGVIAPRNLYQPPQGIALMANVSRATAAFAQRPNGSEWLGKWLHLLTNNAIKLALHESDNPEVRAMDLPRLFDLLLGRAATTCIEHGKLTMWVDTIDCAADRRRIAGARRGLQQT
jgi:hypothetical protein